MNTAKPTVCSDVIRAHVCAPIRAPAGKDVIAICDNIFY